MKHFHIVLLGSLSLLAMQLEAATPLTFLHAQGHDVVDEKGKKVLFRGVGLGNWMLPEGYMWRFGEQGDRPRKIEKLVSELIGPEQAERFWTEFRRNYITEADIARVAELGFNCVRPALNARLFLTEGDEAREVEEGYRLLDNLVGWCRKHGVYVIIDMHGAPGGQTGANIDDSPKDEPGLFMEKHNQDRLVELWVKIARRYKDEPTVAAYDLLNEPLPNRTGAAPKYKHLLEPLYKRLTTAIREIDKRHMITVEGADWANDWSVFSAPPFDPNLLYQFHFYCWDRPTKLNGIDQFLAHRKRLNAPMWVGETGEKDNAIYWATMQYFEANNIGWSFWPWKKMDTRNTPYSIKAPKDWDAIRTYSRGNQPKPPAATAQKCFDELLANIQLANCVYFPDVVNAVFRRVPGRVEAENYGHEGEGKSYRVSDPSQKSKFYRPSEPVLIEQAGSGGDRRGSGQAIVLREGEWTSYLVHSREAKPYTVKCRVKPQAGKAAGELSIGTQRQPLKIEGSDWVELTLQPAALQVGENRVKLQVTSGTALFDWVLFE